MSVIYYSFFEMAISINMKYSLQALAVTCILFFSFTLGKADDYGTQTAAAGVLENEYLPNYGGINGGYSSQNGDYPHEYGGGTGTADAQPGYLFSKALRCFNDKQIYSSCEEAYRLTETGDLNVPPEYTDQYCSGPCLKETHLVLNCLGNILSNFRFYNKATIRVVEETIKEGCSYGPRRGFFNVAEHILADGGTALRASKFMLHGVVLMSLTHIFFL
ncbi:uncharacterized protein LOC107801825 isoform X2 [Nicotiana tabacum]|uniref:Uncharacterized protein LOC107801825 isoform X2 n=2 Tax=Nicotiana TaxID=4085 RepID=A0A1S4AW15_TOBAC|nr:PREDICTED: uncharacterized protein LOC104212657 isoform X2 [Nicotiana sylvestris]XP_016480703.1 PREDICTED: uncharacterized protein LOC107801825 isoform X2 [Nicotiana tabacum]